MRCNCCNVILTPFESTMRKVSDNSFLDMCEGCLSYVSDDVKTLTREDLRAEVGIHLADHIDIDDRSDIYD